ncbi:MAG: class I SAM-dependent methyltransferase [Ornithinimicrobium sp.]
MSDSSTPEHGTNRRIGAPTEDELWSRDVRKMWEGADYPAVAECLRTAALQIGRSAGAGGGRQALDVATGTGSVALELAGADWAVTAVDLAPALMAVGQRHAITRNLSIQWKQASFTQIPLGNASVDVVTSGFGLIFAPDPLQALAEISRVLKPGGRLIFTAWTPTGTMGQMTDLVGSFLDRQEVSMMPFRWGDPTLADTWLQKHFSEIHHRTHFLPWSFETPGQASRWFFDHSPGHHAAFGAAGDRGHALVESVTEWMTDVAGGNRAFDLSPTYVLSSARRP